MPLSVLIILIGRRRYASALKGKFMPYLPLSDGQKLLIGIKFHDRNSLPGIAQTSPKRDVTRRLVEAELRLASKRHVGAEFPVFAWIFRHLPEVLTPVAASHYRYWLGEKAGVGPAFCPAGSVMSLK